MDRALRGLPARLAHGDAAAVGAIALLPLCLLLWPPARFYLDWDNHVWLVAFFGEHLRAHGTLPLAINTEQLAGMPNALFYGYPLYAAAGALSALTGADLAIRAVLAAATLAQVHAVYRLGRAHGADRAAALVVTALAAWSTYALTNLYNRAALTEYLGVCLLTVALAALLRLLPEPSPRARALLLSQAAFAAVLTALVHPITGLLGGMLLLAAWLLVLAASPWRASLVRATVLAALPGVAALAAWVALFLRLGPKLQINGVLGEVLFYPFDNLATRLLPLPFDDRSALKGITDLNTPHLDTQANVALVALLVALAVAVRRARGQGAPATTPLFSAPPVHRRFGLAALALAAAGFLAALLLSLPSDLTRHLPGLLRNVQFGCRFVSYQNLFILLGFVGLAQALAGARIGAAARVALLTAALTAGALSLGLKLQHGAAVLSDAPGPWATSAGAARLPPTFYGRNDFSTRAPRELPYDERFQKLAFTAAPGDFGEPGALEVDYPVDTLVVTNVLHFEDNTILLDGAPLPRPRLMPSLAPVPGPVVLVDKETALIAAVRATALWVPSGRHRLEYAFRPPAGWIGLFLASGAAQLGWGLWLLFARNRATGARPSNPVLPAPTPSNDPVAGRP